MVLGHLYGIIAKVKNYLMYKNNAISKFEYLLRKSYLRSKNSRFSFGEFYQSYPDLNIPGLRPTISRYKLYGLSEFLKPSTMLLDIGGNTGFFSIYLSRFVKQSTILEIDSGLVSVGKSLLKKTKSSNVRFINESFESAHFKSKFDFIMSLAVHCYMSLSFEEYLSKIHSLLNKGGFLLIESHVREWETTTEYRDILNSTSLFKVVKSDFIDDNSGRLREFFILKKI